jgi:imidazolonepropionase
VSDDVPRSLLIYNCGQLLTLRGADGPRRGRAMRDLGIIRRGAVLVENGAIAAVGTERESRSWPGARRARRMDAGGRVVLPGFVDSHTHALFARPRLAEYVLRLQGASYREMAKAGGGIQASAAHLRALSVAALIQRLQRVEPWFLRSGTTTAEVKSGYGLLLDQELKMLRAIRAARRTATIDWIPTLLAHDVPQRFRSMRPAYVRSFAETLIPRAARQQLAEFVDVFCDRGYFTPAETARILDAADRQGLGVKLHAVQLAPSGAVRLGVRRQAVSVDHLDHVRARDITALARSETVATLLPGSSLYLGGRYPSGRRLIDAGVAVALATNFNPGSSPSTNMPLMVSLACGQMGFSPEEAITAATINGAHALGRGDRIGSLAPGTQGDLAMFDVSDYREIPYYFGVSHCWAVIKKGRVAWIA